MIPMQNAAGSVKTLEDVAKIVKVPSEMLHAVTLGSYTLDERPGNSGTTFWDNRWINANPTSLNALGLPNRGIDHVRTILPQAMRMIEDSGKITRVSIAGFSKEDYVELTKKLLGFGIYQIELNFGCPNVRTDGIQEKIFSFDVDRMADTIERVYKADSLGTPVAVKLSPYSDPHLFEEVVRMLKERERLIQEIVSCNTFANASAFNDTLYEENNDISIAANDGYAGLGGAPLKHIALGHVRRLVKAFPSNRIIGVGGILSGKDLWDMHLAGAGMVQIGTGYWIEGPKVFSRIAEECVDRYA